MFNFLHTNIPQPILFAFGQVHIYWYGLIVVLAIITALIVTILLGKRYELDKEMILDLGFWLIIGGILGARIYDVILELPYYLANPLNVFKVWQGGLAIHGAIFAGLIILWFFAKKHKINLWLFGSIIVPGLALGQSIGRWGNYFNQELFGKPTNLPWGIPINYFNRPADYLGNNFFQPTFLYESLGSLLIFLFLILLHFFYIKRPKLAGNINNQKHLLIIVSYFSLYSILRFSLEFIRIDYAPTFFGLRVPQIASLLIIFSVLTIFFTYKKPTNQALEN